MSDARDPIPVRKMDILYNDVLGDVKVLQDRNETAMKMLCKVQESFNDSTSQFLKDLSFRSLDLKQSADQVVAASTKQLEESATRVKTSVLNTLAGEAVAAVRKSAEEAARLALMTPMDSLEKAFLHLEEKTRKLSAMLDQAKKSMTMYWGKVLGIIAATLIGAGSVTFLLYRQIEARIPVYSPSERKEQYAGEILLRAWDSLDPKTQEKIYQLGAKMP